MWSPKAEHPPKLRTALHNTDMQHRQKIQHAGDTSQKNSSLKNNLKLKFPFDDANQINLRLDSRPQNKTKRHISGDGKQVAIYFEVGCSRFHSEV